MTGPTSSGSRTMTRTVDDLEDGEERMIGQASNYDSNQAPDFWHLHGHDSSESSFNSGLLQTGAHFDATLANAVQNHVHYYVHFPNGDESTYQACDRNIEIVRQ